MSTIPLPFALLAAAIVTISAPQARMDAQAPSLRLFLESERPSFTLGEPVYLIARLRNESKTSARLIPLLNPSDGLLVVTLSGPRGERLGFVPLTVRDNDLAPTELGAGGQIAAAFPVFFGAAGWTLRTPGTYIAKARFTIHDGSGRPRVVTSDSVTIRVGDQPAEGATVLMNGNEASLQAGRFLLWSGGDHLARGQALLATLPQRLGTAPVVDHSRLAFGRAFARPFKDYTKGAVRPANCDRAIEDLLQARDDVLPAYLRVQKYLALAKCYRTLGRAAESARAAATARSLIAERPELAEFREQLDRLGNTLGR